MPSRGDSERSNVVRALRFVNSFSILLTLPILLARHTVVTEKVVKAYGAIGVGVMAVMLTMVIFDVLPPSLVVPVFIAAAAIFLGRIVLRIMLMVQRRKQPDTQADNKTPDATDH